MIGTISVWDELGIAPTSDRDAVRRAYAVRLRAVRPDVDPEGFQRLRAAYEAALAGTGGGEAPAPHVQDLAAAAPEARHAPPDAAWMPSDDAAASVASLRGMLAVGDIAGAYALLRSPRLSSTLPFAQAEAIEQELAAAALTSGDLSTTLLREMAEGFGWDKVASPLSRRAPVLYGQVLALFEALGWYENLVAMAQGFGWPKRHAKVAARMLLGRGHWVLFYVFGPVAALRALLFQHDHHAPLLGSRFDAVRIAWCRRLLESKVRRGWLNFLLLLPLAAIAVWNPFCAVGALLLRTLLLPLRPGVGIFVYLGLVATIIAAIVGPIEAPFERLVREASNGNADSAYQVGLSYENGKRVAHDDTAAADWFKRAVSGGSLPAMVALGGLYEQGRGVAKDENRAIDLYRQAADQGSTDAMMRAGGLLDKRQRYNEALALFRAASDRGVAVAAFNVGVYYENGRGVTADRNAALAWFRKSAEQGVALAEKAVGIYLLNGLGGEKPDAVQAAFWIGKSAGDGNSQAEALLGQLYASGTGVPRDYDKALQFLTGAAGKGDADAAASLGLLYLQGTGVKVDYAAARRWFEDAAQRGNTMAMNGLGFLYLQGAGGAADTAKGLDLIARAAASGQPNAMYNLGVLSRDGIGLPAPDFGLAYKWLSLSIRGFPAGDPGLPGARAALAGVEARLGADERRLVDREVAAWHAVPPTPIGAASRDQR